MRIGSLMAMVRSLMAEGRRVSPAVLATIGKGPQTSLRYPEWRSERKARGWRPG